jgi:peptidoglycan/xylan/chitin deacetylase (PgdA/CDA1 family)
MATSSVLRGKRELLAQSLYWSGISSLLCRMPAKDSLLVLNYHRIGDSKADLYNPETFSCTGEELDEQVSFLKRRLTLVTLEEAQAFVEGKMTKNRHPTCRVLLTFDDGYLDNYTIAYPILRSHGAQGVFFLATSIVGSCDVPWWDHIAYVIRTAGQPKFTLRYPAELSVNIADDGFAASLRAVLTLYTRPDNTDSERFVRELEEQAQGETGPNGVRRFLNWEEAKEMIAGGMAIGSHTHSHRILNQLPADRQREELFGARKQLTERLGVEIDTITYPVGLTDSFSKITQQLARETGYRAAFSYYGGINLPGATQPYDIQRIGIGGPSRTRFRVQSTVCRWSGKSWP